MSAMITASRVSALGIGDVLVDRDGVLIAELAGYVLHPSQVELLPGAGDAVHRLCAAGCRVFVVTNQSPVGRGLIGLDTLRAIHRRLATLIRAAGGTIAGFFVCPHHPDAGCGCRKPEPGLLYAARDRAGVDLSRAVMVGDQLSDIAAAQRAGCRAVLVRNGAQARRGPLPAAVRAHADLLSAVDEMLGACQVSRCVPGIALRADDGAATPTMEHMTGSPAPAGSGPGSGE